MSKKVFININKIDAKNRDSQQKLFKKFNEGVWFEPYPILKEREKYSVKNDEKCLYAFLNYRRDNNKNIIESIILCDMRNSDNVVEIKRICSICSEHYIKYILKEIMIDVNDDFDTYGDYLRVIESSEVYNRLYDYYIFYCDNMRSISDARQYDIVQDEKSYHDLRAISYCKAYRRLQDKAQIFSLEKGDHYRTRLTHTNDVRIISKIMTDKLNNKIKMCGKEYIIDCNVVEAIAIGHDIGHTPFGHQGERTLNDIIKGNNCNIIKNSGDRLYKDMGGFKHNVQSVRVLTELEYESNKYKGLNISYEILEGVLKHSEYVINDVIKMVDANIVEKLHIELSEIEKKDDSILYGKHKYNNYYITGKIVDLADEIAQRGSDIEDAIRANKFSVEVLLKNLETTKYGSSVKSWKEIVNNAKIHILDEENINIYLIKNKIMDYLIDDIVDNVVVEKCNSVDEIELCFSDDGKRFNELLERYTINKVIMSNDVVSFDSSASKIVRSLFQCYYANPSLLNDNTIRKIYIDMLNNKYLRHYAIDFRNFEQDYINNCISDICKLNLEGFGKISIITEEMKEDIVKLLPIEIKSKYSNSEEINMFISYEQEKIIIRNICDFIAGMTDSFAIKEYNDKVLCIK